jgi:hypothetical protein
MQPQLSQPAAHPGAGGFFIGWTLERAIMSYSGINCSYEHSIFHIHDGGEKPVAAHDSAGRKRLAEYLLRQPFSLQKITG